MKRISQRELRNDNAEIIRGVESGESYTVTRRGVPVARLVPFTDDAGLRAVRPARTRPSFSALQRVASPVPTEEILADLRDGPVSRWYIDTSAAAKLLIEEPESSALARDALHLAAAVRLGVDAMLTYDVRMDEAARELGIPVVAPDLRPA